MSDFKCVALLATLDLPEVKETLRKLAILLKAISVRVVFEKRTATLMQSAPEDELMVAEFPGVVDLVIVVGGDGSMLSASRELASIGIPLLGINRGRLGFLTDIYPEEIEEKVPLVVKGEYLCEKRFLLESKIVRDGVIIETGIALNDVVFHSGKPLRMLEFELYVDDEFVYSQRSDGLIISTPTGSTAYALSAGGPLLFPELDAIVLVPLNPHTLNSRPIALQGAAQIAIRVGYGNDLVSQITCDGHSDLATEPGDMIRVAKHNHQINLVHSRDNNFYRVCRSKLSWGSRLGASEKNA